MVGVATRAMEVAIVVAEAIVVVVATRAMEVAMVVAEAMVAVATAEAMAMDLAVATAVMEVATKAMEVVLFAICITEVVTLFVLLMSSRFLGYHG